MIDYSAKIRVSLLVGASIAALVAGPVRAQSTLAQQPGRQDGTDKRAGASADEPGLGDIVVTAQRQSETLQNVPIAVSAFSAETLERQQIDNPSDLQLTLPSITYTKTAFTSSSFTIRGIGDLCVGITCDAATAIHTNGSPLIGTRLFETEFFDLERVEVLRGPQSTLFGRNATAGVVNFITAKPNLSRMMASGEIEYGNFDSTKIKGMVNVPLGETLSVRLAGYYLNRDGYTQNLYDGSRIDGRNIYAVRGSLRWQPTDRTTIDLMGYYFHENDDRMRIQKHLCQRDPTGVLGCLPGRTGYELPNNNATFFGTLGSRELLRIQGGAALGPAITSLGLTSLYGPDNNTGGVNPADPRQVRTDFNPQYFADEQQYQARIDHDFGPVGLQVTGLYTTSRVDSKQDHTISVANGSIYTNGLTALQNYATLVPVPIGPALGALLAPVAAAIIPNGPAGPYCTSDTEGTGTGAFGGHAICGSTPLDFDRSVGRNRTWSAEAIATTKFDGPLNFLAGAIYLDNRVPENSYYVSNFAVDYVAGVLGAVTALGQRLGGNTGFPAVYLGTPYFRNQTAIYRLKSYGLFGEAYWDMADRLKLTLGLRYNNDKKYVQARTTLVSFAVPYGSTDAFASPYAAGFDADATTPCTTPGSTVAGAIGSRPGCDAYQVRETKAGKFTGRAVVDFKLNNRSLFYASYSRGYKSGGINPPLSPIFGVPQTFAPEFVDAFEVGSKNTLLGGTLQLNLTGFYYKYKGLQLSRLIARSSVNDNVDANIYGVEAEAVIRPSRSFLVNMNFSYLKTKVASDKFLANPRDPSGGRSDAVIIKDITNGSNCAVVPTQASNAAGANAYVATINQAIGAGVGDPTLLRAPGAFPADSGLNGATGAFGLCSALQNSIANPSTGLRALFATPTGALPFTLEASGVLSNIRGNTLPQAPRFKFSTGAQYTQDFANGMTLVPRIDLAFTGESYGNIFNGYINKVDAFTVINAQVQLNGRDDRWFVRGFVQNLTDNSATTGFGVADASVGVYTSIFTLEPRRYGIAAGFKF